MFDEQVVIERLADWRAGRPRPPHTLNIRPTGACNLRCGFCISPLDRRPQSKRSELPSNALVDAVRRAGEMGVMMLKIDGGGEPLVRREATLDMIRVAKRAGMRGYLVTNGTLIDRKDAGAIAETGWDEVRFSIDGPDPQTNDSMRGVKGAFERATRGVRFIVEAREKLHSKKPVVSVAPVLTNLNFDTAGKFVRLAADLGVQEICFQPLYTKIEQAYGFLPSKEQRAAFQEGISSAVKLARKSGIGTNLSDLRDGKILEKSNRAGEVGEASARSCRTDNPFLSLACFVPWLYAGIVETGNVVPCPSMDFDTPGLPDLRRSDFAAVWEGEFFTSFRRRLLAKERIRMCASCCALVVLDTMELRRALAKQAVPSN